MFLLMFFFFFFQAEDGIRDLTVTGVQTCALPILSAKSVPGAIPNWPNRVPAGTPRAVGTGASARSSRWFSSTLPKTASRSEEHTSELQSQSNLVCRLLLEKKKKKIA